MLKGIASIFGYAMKFIYDIVQNYGLAIIIFTIFVKILLLPLAIKQQKSMDKMKEIQPLYQELQRKYGDDNQRLAMEYQKLLKEKNMNMASGMGCSGCILSLIQFPIILGLFYIMVSPLTYILKLPEENISQYKENLNSYYAEQAVQNAIESGVELTSGDIEDYKAKNYLEKTRYYELVIAKQENLFNMNFLGINLGDSANENKTEYVLYIIPVLCMLATFASLKIATNETNSNKEAMQKNQVKSNENAKDLVPKNEEIPMPDMSYMNVIMPFMTGYIAFIAPQGLGLYWTVNSLLQLLQTVLLKKYKEKLVK